VSGQIQLQGAQVTVYDPRAVPNAQKLFPTLGYASSAIEACEAADLVLHLTEWQEFREMDPAVLDGVVTEKRIIDARNALDPARWRAAGWTYGSLGRP
jgi:UDPglucose 6-dehydrogenase